MLNLRPLDRLASRECKRALGAWEIIEDLERLLKSWNVISVRIRRDRRATRLFQRVKREQFHFRRMPSDINVEELLNLLKIGNFLRGYESFSRFLMREQLNFRIMLSDINIRELLKALKLF